MCFTNYIQLYTFQILRGTKMLIHWDVECATIVEVSLILIFQCHVMFKTIFQKEIWSRYAYMTNINEMIILVYLLYGQKAQTHTSHLIWNTKKTVSVDISNFKPDASILFPKTYTVKWYGIFFLASSNRLYTVPSQMFVYSRSWLVLSDGCGNKIECTSEQSDCTEIWMPLHW